MPDIDHSPPRPDAPTARMLLARAREARAHAYARYSRFPVGAALLAQGGRVFGGCNVENASYGLSNCAERTAVFTAVSEGVQAFDAVAVVGPEDGVACAPCGACRQVLAEFGPGMWVVTEDPEGEDGVRLTPLRDLLPGAFDGARLPARAEGVQ